MSNFGEDGLQKLVSMNLFVPETCFFVLGALKIGGGGVVASPQQGKKLATVVWCLCLGPVGGWVRVLLTPSVLAGV